MADEKKPEAKPAASSEAAPIAAEIISLLVFLFIIMSLFNSISNRFSNSHLLSKGLSGLTPRSVLLSHTRPISSLFQPISAKVISVNSTSVYDSPGSKKIGSQKIGARGKILQGPVDINGEKYWYVDYDSGVDGWVKERDIAYLESEPNLFERFFIWVLSIVTYIKIIIILFSILCLLYILYLNAKISPILENERKLLYPILAKEENITNQKWEKVLAHVESLNESDWRIAIIEADIILDELLDKLSLPGDSIGEKLKAVEKSDFRTLDDAWEAHKSRNRISHDGQEYILNQREAKRVIGLYEKVFKEFEII